MVLTANTLARYLVPEGDSTPTTLSGLRILSPLRLPVSPSRLDSRTWCFSSPARANTAQFNSSFRRISPLCDVGLWSNRWPGQAGKNRIRLADQALTFFLRDTLSQGRGYGLHVAAQRVATCLRPVLLQGLQRQIQQIQKLQLRGVLLKSAALVAAMRASTSFVGWMVTPTGKFAMMPGESSSHAVA